MIAPVPQESSTRHRESLLRELGDSVAQALADDDITEVMRNADGELWIDSRTRGLARLDATMSDPQTKSLLSTIAGLLNRVINDQHPSGSLANRICNGDLWRPDRGDHLVELGLSSSAKQCHQLGSSSISPGCHLSASWLFFVTTKRNRPFSTIS